MNADSAARASVHPGLIWGRESLDGQTRALEDADLASAPEQPAGFRWLHLSLADQPTRRWIGACAALPPQVRDLLLSADARPRAVVEDGVAGFVLQDVERDFDDGETRVGVLRFAVGPRLMLTARGHPLRSADIARERLAGGCPVDAAAALELLLGAMAEAAHRTVIEVDRTVQAVEDDLLRDAAPSPGRALVVLRLLMVRMHRLFSSNRAVLRELIEEAAPPPALGPVLARAMERLADFDTELLAMQGQLRLLREEIDLQATQKTNQNLYVLSILTALMMPATLVTGLFGMNTGGLPWAMTPRGTIYATLLAIGSALAVYWALRLKGFFRQ